MGVIGVIGTVEYTHADHKPQPEITADLVIDNPCSNSFEIIGNHDMIKGNYHIEIDYENGNSILDHLNIPNNNEQTFRHEYYIDAIKGTSNYGNHHVITYWSKWITGTYTITLHSIEIHSIQHVPVHETSDNYIIKRKLYVTPNPDNSEQLCFNLKEHLNGQIPEPPTIPKTRLQLANEKIERL